MSKPFSPSLALTLITVLSASVGCGPVLPAGPPATPASAVLQAGTQNTGRPVVVRLDIAGMRILAAAKTLADVDHFHLKLVDTNTKAVVAEGDTNQTQTVFTNVADGTYSLLADAIDSNGQSIVKGGEQTSVNTVTVKSPKVSYSLDRNSLQVVLNLLDATGEAVQTQLIVNPGKDATPAMGGALPSPSPSATPSPSPTPSATPSPSPTPSPSSADLQVVGFVGNVNGKSGAYFIVTNQGTATSPATTLSCDSGGMNSTYPIPSLAPGAHTSPLPIGSNTAWGTNAGLIFSATVDPANGIAEANESNNTLQVNEASIPAAANLVLIPLKFSPNGTKSAAFWVVNRGKTAAPASVAYQSSLVPGGSGGGNLNVPALAPGEVSGPLNCWSGSLWGDPTYDCGFTMKVDTTNAVPEADETDNVSTVNY